MSLDIGIINFGAPAAERDQGLKEYFVESESFRRMRAGEKVFLLGNRGTGKSAIFKMLAEEYRRKGDVVVEVSPDEYSYEIFSDIMAAESQGNWAKQAAYAAAWKYLFYVLAMKKQAECDFSFLKRNSKKIYSYLRDNFSGEQYSMIDALISYMKRIEGVKIGPYEAMIKSKDLQKLYQLEEICDLVEELKKVCDKKPIIFLVDELDRGWDASEDAKAFVAGLFQAAVAINTHMGAGLRVVVSLRKELYENIPLLYEDAQKVWDLFETITWEENALLKMISKRILCNYPSYNCLSDLEAWNMLFSETLDYRQAKSFNYVVDRTLYRPREIVNFCSEIKDVALKINASVPINYQTISSAEYVYSENRAKDIAAEYRFQYPGLMSVFETFRGKSFNYDREDLEYHCMEVIYSGNKMDWLDSQEPEYLISVLWQVGFIKAQATGGLKARQRSGSSYLGSHQISNLNLATINRFHIHPMFRSYFGLKEAK
ncbi:DUF815 domain-containing protein [bacterium]|nr:DUF815 domain-containing protein [bacterium]